MKSLIRWIQNQYDLLTFDKHRLGKFWCNKHWSIIRASQKDERPINPAIAAIGITAALYLKGVDSDIIRKTGAACCWLYDMAEGTPKTSGKIMLDGIFEKSRGWKNDGV